MVTSSGSAFFCRNPSGNTCSWLGGDDGGDSFHQGKKYFLSVQAVNSMGESESPYKMFNTEFLVEPKAVDELEVDHPGKRKLCLKWRKPVENKAFQYKVKFKSHWGSPVQDGPDVLEEKVCLPNLIPNTRYEITVSAIPYINGKPTGYWSKESTLKISTYSDVPDEAPPVTSSNFHITDVSENKRNVTLYWKPIPAMLRHGTIQEIRVRYEEIQDLNTTLLSWNASSKQARTVTVDHRMNYTTLTLEKTKAYGITIDARTEKGFNSFLSLTPIIIHKGGEKLTQPSNFVVVGNSTGSYLQWDAVPQASRYIIFQCLRPLYQGKCVNAMRWQIVSGNSTQISRPMKSFSNYKFAIATEMINDFGHVSSSGMRMSECTYSLELPVIQPVEFKVSEHQIGGQLLVEWMKRSCENTGYISGFELAYCEVEVCDVKEESISVESNHENMKYQEVIPGLTPFAKYRVRVRSVSPFSDPSAWSGPLIAEVQRTGLTTGEIVGIVIGCIIVIFFVILGIIAIVRKCSKSVKKTIDLTIVMPKEIEADDPGDAYVTLDQGDHSSHVQYYVSGSSGLTQVKQNALNYQKEKLLNGNNKGMNGGIPGSSATSSAEPTEVLTEDGAMAQTPAGLHGYKVPRPQPGEHLTDGDKPDPQSGGPSERDALLSQQGECEETINALENYLDSESGVGPSENSKVYLPADRLTAVTDCDDTQSGGSLISPYSRAGPSSRESSLKPGSNYVDNMTPFMNGSSRNDNNSNNNAMNQPSYVTITNDPDYICPDSEEARRDEAVVVNGTQPQLNPDGYVQRPLDVSTNESSQSDLTQSGEYSPVESAIFSLPPPTVSSASYVANDLPNS